MSWIPFILFQRLNLIDREIRTYLTRILYSIWMVYNFRGGDKQINWLCVNMNSRSLCKLFQLLSTPIVYIAGSMSFFSPSSCHPNKPKSEWMAIICIWIAFSLNCLPTVSLWHISYVNIIYEWQWIQNVSWYEHISTRFFLLLDQ